MGLLRFLLAMTVVLAHLHTDTLLLGDSRFAVQMFFIISGFYISMVWDEKYSGLNKPVQTFYVSRALRIYPLYFVVLALSVLVAWYGLGSGHISALMALLAYPLSGALSLVAYATQLTLLGLDSYVFLGRLGDGSVVVASHLVTYPRPQIIEYMFVPQAWSLSLELTFYLIAPFILKRTKWLIGLLVVSLGLRLVMWHSGFDHDPWTTRFFPLEAALFIAGALSYKAWASIRQILWEGEARRRLLLPVCVLPILAALFIKIIVEKLGEAAYWWCYAVTVFSLPLLFEVTKSWKYDRMLGDLSYPIYISHWFVIAIFFMLDQPMDKIYPLAIPLTILVSVLLNLVQNKIDRFRHRLASA